MNYYRLKIVDEDEQFEYTDPVYVKVGASTLEFISVKPVPTLDQVEVSFISSIKEPLIVEVLNILGETVIHHQYQPAFGENKVRLSLKELQAGVYFLNIANQRESQIQTKLIKQ